MSRDMSSGKQEVLITTQLHQKHRISAALISVVLLQQCNTAMRGDAGASKPFESSKIKKTPRLIFRSDVVSMA
jgi:hypothetical protein